jgi:TRAP-type mannitol/chloroaromatic compound transport system permease large subunit
VGAMGAFLLALAYKRMNLTRLRESAFLTARTTAMVCWLLVGSWVFSSTFATLGGQQVLENFIFGMDLSPGGFLFLTQFIIFLLGWPLDWTVIIIIFVPIFLPMLPQFGIDPLFFGLLTALNLQTAFLSPPMAMAAYYLKGVSPPSVTLGDIFMGMIPFMLIQLSAVVLLATFPEIGLWLPRLFYQ